jgi:integrase
MSGVKHLTDSLVKRLTATGKSHRVVFDDTVTGFACRVTTAGGKSYILSYQTRGGKQRRYTIGSCSDWQAAAARAYARELKKRIRTEDYDPLAALREAREAPTVADLCERFLDEHLPKMRRRSGENYATTIRRDILPAMKHAKVSEVTFTDVDALHRKITKRGHRVQANRTLACLSKMFSMAIKWGWRSDNPTRGVERNQEVKRERYLSPDEMTRLTEALARMADQQAAAIVRVLMMTGARRGEVLAMRWDQVDFESETWTKPASLTKQNKTHAVPLSPPVLQILSEVRSGQSDYVFPGPGGTGHREGIRRPWARLLKDAKITGVRIHDVRHTFASILASSGSSLQLIGSLLGHSQPSTTARYAHLMDEPQRAAARRVSAIVSGEGKGEVVEIRRK